MRKAVGILLIIFSLAILIHDAISGRFRTFRKVHNVDDLNSQLHDVAANGDIKRVEVLLRMGADVNSRGRAESTALHCAALSENKRLVTFLIENGADLNAEDDTGSPPVDYAAGREDKGMVALLLARGAYNPWEKSLQEGIQGATRMRVRSGGTCHRVPEWEKTLFEENDSDAINSFVRSLKVDMVESRGACMCCGNPTIEFYDKDQLVFFFGIHHGKRLRLHSREGQRGGDAELTPEAAEYLCKWLAERGVDGPLRELTDMRERRKQRALLAERLLAATQAGDFETARSILKEDVDVGVRLDGGSTLLNEAISKGADAPIVKAIIDKGADVSAKDESGWAPLHCAAAFGNREVVALLISEYADVNLRDDDGRTPLDIAEQSGHKHIEDLLRKHGGKTGKEIK